MARETSSDLIGDIRDQLNLQAEAILKLVEVVSGLEGVDAASLGAYAVHIQRLRADPISPPTGDGRAIGAPFQAPDTRSDDSREHSVDNAAAPPSPT